MDTHPEAGLTVPAHDTTRGGHGPDGAGMWTQPVAVLDWMLAHDLDATPPLTITRVGIGQSNITTVITDAAGGEWVMREPPPGTSAGSAHDLLREAGILRALSGSGVPVPRLVGTGTSPEGSPFLVMERVAGAALENEQDAHALTPAQRRDLGVSVAATLATLHRLDPDILGIEVSRSPYVARQIRRVTAAWDLVCTESRHDRDWRAVRDGLAERMPQAGPPAIMHGDYRLSNLLVSAGRITAVLDWELCTVGDPLADLAWLLDDWRPADEPAIVMPSPTRAGGFPDRDEMVSVYREVTGCRVDELDYYRAFTQWRAASLLEGVRARRRSGAMGSHAAIDPEELEDSIGVLLTSAAAQIRATR
ncbi:phosphotransferase family protein [Mycobacterium sp. ITM-2016-00316]|uniref:phosphotransferase family protein n=1 Tax=Mycobacterium sp. ITM-2016-00316 TaxID=2099695 RepID=UPI000CFA73CC|nr:phosphotransferase family protein [Mycobacterium sp. ITM-2016-00316]WNG83555.1 phosphotransferase family protein [Mycobacterium sp. ITM-2016-00316]